MSETISYLSLPFVPQKIIIRQLDPSVVLELALKNKKFYQNLRCVKLHVGKFLWNFKSGNLGADFHIKVFLDSTWNSPFVHFTTAEQESFDSDKISDELPQDLSNVQLEIKSDQHSKYVRPANIIIKDELSMLKLMEIYTKYVWGLLLIKEHELKTDYYEELNMANCFVWNFTKKFERLVFTPKINRDVTKEIQPLKKNIRADILCVKFQEGHLPQESLYLVSSNYKEVHLTHFENFPLRYFLNLQSDCFQIRSKTVKASDITAIIKKWVDGGLENLEDFRVFFSFPEIIENVKQFCSAEFDAKQVAVATHPMLERLQKPFFELALDIQVKERKATINSAPGLFQFLVWKETYNSSPSICICG